MATDETRALVDEINALVETGSEEIERLRARVAELEDENERLRDEAERFRIAAARTALPVLLADLRALRARVAELEEENERLRWVVRASCVRTPTPGCDCPGCETARERAAQADLVASYEAELEEDRQAERDRILGARVREVLEANGTNPERFVSEWCRAQAEHETEEAAR